VGMFFNTEGKFLSNHANQWVGESNPSRRLSYLMATGQKFMLQDWRFPMCSTLAKSTGYLPNRPVECPGNTLNENISRVFESGIQVEMQDF